jgi:tripartite-type tricarboxylate transporter receptor subunit TctC
MEMLSRFGATRGRASDRSPDAVQHGAQRGDAPQSRGLQGRRALYDPGSAAHRFALRCARETSVALYAAGALLACALTADAARADTYPSRIITLVVPSSPGGPGDVSARLIADRMSQSLGQQIIIETAPGAGGTIGMARVARAAPDGYTLMIHQNGFAITPALYAKLTFDTAKDFTTVGLVNRSYVYLVGRKSLPAQNFAELTAWMKGPGKPAKFAHPGTGTVGHLNTVVLVSLIGAETNLVPYRGIAPAVNDLLGEHIDLAQVGAAVAAPLMKAGRIRGYASAASKRDPGLPDVPTFGELGLKELERPFWHALFAPAATPKPVLEKLNAALRDALNDPRVQQAYAASGVEAYPQNLWPLDAAHAYVREEIDYWAGVVRKNDVKVE